jgi:FKBP-type peptidyl-prolyl cis-trans isomerase SlyD
MKIAKDTVVTVNYKLSDAQNNLIEEGVQPMVYLHGGYETTLPNPGGTVRCVWRL